jgi:hypothetical protein
VAAEPPARADAQVRLVLPPDARQPASSGSPDGGTPWGGVAAGTVVVALIGVAALWRARAASAARTRARS